MHTRKLEIGIVSLITFLGIGLRLWLWDTQAIPGIDGTTYIRLARSLAGEPGFETVHQYGFPALIWVAHLFTSDWILAGRIMPMMFGVLLIPVTFLLARRVTSSFLLALFPTVAVAFMALPLRYSLTTMTETPYQVFLMLFFLGVCLRRYLAGGVAAGIAYTIRPEVLLITGVVALLHWKSKRAAGLILLGAVLVATPYVITMGVTQGKWTLSGKGINFGHSDWRANETPVGAEAVETGALSRLSEYGGDIARAYPGRAVRVGEQLLRNGGWVVPVVALFGITAGSALLLAGLVPIFILPAIFVGERTRFVFPYLPFLWILAAVAVGRVKKPPLRFGLAALLIAGLGVSAYTERHQYTMNEDNPLPETVRTGKWMANFVQPDDVIYDRKPYAAFYAGGQPRTIPSGSYEGILNEITTRGGDYLVLNDAIVRAFRPELLPLVTSRTMVLGEHRLVPIFHEVSERGLRTIVFRIVRPGGPPPMRGEERIRESLYLLPP